MADSAATASDYGMVHSTEQENVFNMYDWMAVVVYFTAILLIVFVVGASLFSSNIGAQHFIGLAGSGAASGISVGAFELNALILLQLLGWMFLPVYIGTGVSTLPEYMKYRFGRERIRVVLAVLSLFLYMFSKISVDLYAGALFVEQALKWNIYISALLLLLLTAICSLVGGLRTVIYIETFQFVIMIVGGLALMFRALDIIGGFDMLISLYMKAVPSTIPPGNHTCGQPDPSSWVLLRGIYDSNLPWLGFLLGQVPASIWYWCADQVMVQRALASKSLSHAQGGTLAAGYLKTLPLFMIIIPGMISRVLYPDEVGCVDPEVCQKVCGNPMSCSNIAYPRLVMGIMPAGVRGAMLTVMISALMSDLISIFNSSSSLFTLDIWKRMRPSSSSRELLLVGRIFIFIIIVVSLAWVPVIQEMQSGQLFIYIQALTAYFTPPLASVYLLALLSPKVNEQSAFYGLLLGIAIGIVRLVLELLYPENRCYESFYRPAILSKVHYMYFAAISFWVTVIAIIAISYLFPEHNHPMLENATLWSAYEKMRLSTKKRGASTTNSQLTSTACGQAAGTVTAAVLSSSLTIQPAAAKVERKGADEAQDEEEETSKIRQKMLRIMRRLWKAEDLVEAEVPAVAPLPSLHQKKWEVYVLNFNLVVMILLCVSLFLTFTFLIHVSDDAGDVR